MWSKLSLSAPQSSVFNAVREVLTGRIQPLLFPRATSQTDALVHPLGDCREGQIPRSLCGVFDFLTEAEYSFAAGGTVRTDEYLKLAWFTYIVHSNIIKATTRLSPGSRNTLQNPFSSRTGRVTLADTS